MKYTIAFYALLAILLITIALTIYSTMITIEQTDKINQEIEECREYLEMKR